MCDKWTKIENKVPPYGVYLVCYKTKEMNDDDFDIGIAGYWHFGWGLLDLDRPIKPTHWMDLPSPPDELFEGK